MAKFKPSTESTFRPSPQSRTPVEQAVVMLRYFRKASEVVEAYILKTGHVPPWIFGRIQQAALNLGMAVSYAQNATPVEQPEKLKLNPAPTGGGKK